MKKFLMSFKYAASGIKLALREERNMRFHLVAAFYVVLFAGFYGFSAGEKCILALCIAGVIALEMVNTALERAVDSPSPERYELAGAVKDIAAGAVLVFSIGAAVCGVMLFSRRAGLYNALAFFMARPLFAVLLIASLVCVFICF